MQSLSSCHHSHLVVFALVHHLKKVRFYLRASANSNQAIDPHTHAHTLLTNLSLANMEVLVAVVDDGAVLAAGADVANTLCGDEERNNERTLNRLQL